MSSSSGTSEINGTSDARRARSPRRAGVARAAGAFLLVASALTACNAGRLTGPATPDEGSAVAITGPTELVREPLDAVDAPAIEVAFENWVEKNCNLELVPMRGKARITLFPSDHDVTHFRFHMHWVADGTGSFGNVYHGSSQYEQMENSSVFPFSFTSGHQLTLKSQSSLVPDLRVKVLVHVTIVAPGRMTASVDRMSVDCQQ